MINFQSGFLGNRTNFTHPVGLVKIITIEYWSTSMLCVCKKKKKHKKENTEQEDILSADVFYLQGMTMSFCLTNKK